MKLKFRIPETKCIWGGWLYLGRLIFGILQTLCEQLRHENNELRKKMEDDLQYRNLDLEQLR